MKNLIKLMAVGIMLTASSANATHPVKKLMEGVVLQTNPSLVPTHQIDGVIVTRNLDQPVNDALIQYYAGQKRSVSINILPVITGTDGKLQVLNYQVAPVLFESAYKNAFNALSQVGVQTRIYPNPQPNNIGLPWYDPTGDNFKALCNRVGQIRTDQKAEQVQIGLALNQAENGQETLLTNYTPDRRYVDNVRIDARNFGLKMTWSTWTPVMQSFQGSTTMMASLYPNIPICWEWASVSLPADPNAKAKLIQEFVQTAQSDGMGQVGEVCYSNESIAHLDWALNNNELVAYCGVPVQVAPVVPQTPSQTPTPTGGTTNQAGSNSSATVTVDVEQTNQQDVEQTNSQDTTAIGGSSGAVGGNGNVVNGGNQGNTGNGNSGSQTTPTGTGTNPPPPPAPPAGGQTPPKP
jgi:hypothetical protein